MLFHDLTSVEPTIPLQNFGESPRSVLAFIGRKVIGNAVREENHEIARLRFETDFVVVAVGEQAKRYAFRVRVEVILLSRQIMGGDPPALAIVKDRVVSDPRASEEESGSGLPLCDGPARHSVPSSVPRVCAVGARECA